MLHVVKRKVLQSDADAPEPSTALVEVAQAARPRYHIAASQTKFYQRTPYMNKDLGAGAHATRFISLAPVGNPEKAKWLHALGVVPAAQMTTEALHARPAGCTESPYMMAGSSKRPVCPSSVRLTLHLVLDSLIDHDSDTHCGAYWHTIWCRFFHLHIAFLVLASQGRIFVINTD